MASSAVLAPMELIARRMQVSRLSLATAARLSARRGELFAGFGSFLARELPFDTIQMTAFEAMKRATLAIEGAVEDLTGYYRDHVIAGPGAFVVTANGFNDYPRRIRQKLLREVTKQIAAVER